MQFHALHVLNFEPLKSKLALGHDINSSMETFNWANQIQVMAQKIQVEPKRHSSQQMWYFKSKLYIRLRIIPS